MYPMLGLTAAYFAASGMGGVNAVCLKFDQISRRPRGHLVTAGKAAN